MKFVRKIISLLLVWGMFLGVTTPAAASYTPADLTREPGKFKIAIQLYDYDTGQPLPYVTVNVKYNDGNHNNNNDGGSNRVILAAITTESDGKGYVELPIRQSGNNYYVTGLNYSDIQLRAGQANYMIDCDAADQANWNFNLNPIGGTYRVRRVTHNEWIAIQPQGNTHDNASIDSRVSEGLSLEFSVWLDSQDDIRRVTYDTSTVASGWNNGVTYYDVTKGATVSQPADPVNSSDPDKVFLGWYSNDELYDFTRPVNEDITLVPRWETSGTIHINVNYWDHDAYWLNPYPNSYHPNINQHLDATHAAQTNNPVKGLKFEVCTYLQGQSSQRTVLGYFEPAADSNSGIFKLDSTKLAMLTVGSVIDIDPVLSDMATYYDPHLQQEVVTTFDWDWETGSSGGGTGTGETGAGQGAAGLTGVRVMPNNLISGIGQGTNDNDVALITNATMLQSIQNDGFEFTWNLWVVPAVWVAFDSDGGTPDYPTQRFQPVNSIPGQQHQYRATNPGSPTKGDMAFIGWYEVDPITGNLADTPFDFSRIITYSRTLKARYAEHPYYVNWYNGSTLLETDTVLSSDYPVYDGLTPVKPNTDTDDYTFIGWTDDPAGTTVDYDPVYYPDSANEFPTVGNAPTLSNYTVNYYAVYAEHEHFYVYHSSNHTVEKIYMDDARVVNGQIDLTALTADGYLYGGYYNNYSKKSTGFNAASLSYTKANGKYTSTDTGGISYTGGIGIWKAANAYNTPGTALSVVKDTTYYLKEVPSYYLKPYLAVVFKTNDNNRVIGNYLISALDDNNYGDYGLIKAGDTQGDVNKTSKYKLATKLAVTSSSGTVNYDVPTVTGTTGAKGYVAVWKYDPALSGTYTYAPAFVTPDGIVVEGTAERTVTSGSGLYTGSLTSGDGYRYSDSANNFINTDAGCTSLRRNSTIISGE